MATKKAISKTPKKRSASHINKSITKKAGVKGGEKPKNTFTPKKDGGEVELTRWGYNEEDFPTETRFLKKILSRYFGEELETYSADWSVPVFAVNIDKGIYITIDDDSNVVLGERLETDGNEPSDFVDWVEIVKATNGQELMLLIDKAENDYTDAPPYKAYFDKQESFELGTPVVYHSLDYNGKQKEESGSIVMGKDPIQKGIELYPNENYSGDKRLFIAPNWNNVETFYDAGERGSEPFSITEIKYSDGGQVGEHSLVYSIWSKMMGGNGIDGSIRTTPQNYYVATIDKQGEISFGRLDAKTKDIDKDEVKKLWKENKIPKEKLSWNDKRLKDFPDKTEKKAKGGSVKDNEFNYMMLDRMRSDNDYFLGRDTAYEGHLYMGNVEEQISEMKKLWNNLPKDGKPEWLSMEDISDYETKMKSKLTTTLEKGGKVEYNEKDLKRFNELEVKMADVDLSDSEIKEYNELTDSLFRDKKENGGKIEYDGSSKNIWDNWNENQREHFLSDHYHFFDGAYSDRLVYKTRSWNKLPKKVKDEVSEHIESGKYNKGGEIKNKSNWFTGALSFLNW